MEWAGFCLVMAVEDESGAVEAAAVDLLLGLALLVLLLWLAVLLAALCFLLTALPFPFTVFDVSVGLCSLSTPFTSAVLLSVLCFRLCRTPPSTPLSLDDELCDDSDEADDTCDTGL